MSMSHGPGQAWWETHLDAIEREGIGTKAYAQREGLPVSSLYYWRRRLKMQKSNSPQPDKPASEPVARQFVPVKLGDAAGGTLRPPAQSVVIPPELGALKSRVKRPWPAAVWG